MTTAAVSPAVTLHGARYDRSFYSGMAIAMAVTVLVGFGPTFYLRPLFGAPVTVTGASSLSTIAVIHGVVFSLWVGLFVAQTRLIASQRVSLHRQMGYAGGVLAALMIVLGILTAVSAAKRGASAPGIDPRAFLVVPMFDILLFAVFVTAAIRARRNKEAHKRLMLMAYISIMVAAVARIPGVVGLGPLGFFGLTTIFIIIGAGYDWFSRRRIHAVYLWGGALFIVSVPLRLALSGTAMWQRFAESLMRS